MTGRAEPLLWPPGASAVNHTSFRLIYICFENNDDPEIEGRKARLPWCPGLGSISKDTNALVLRTPPGPRAPSSVLSRGPPAPWDAVLPSQTPCALSATLQGQERSWSVGLPQTSSDFEEDAGPCFSKDMPLNALDLC